MSRRRCSASSSIGHVQFFVRCSLGRPIALFVVPPLAIPLLGVRILLHLHRAPPSSPPSSHHLSADLLPRSQIQLRGGFIAHTAMPRHLAPPHLLLLHHVINKADGFIYFTVVCCIVFSVYVVIWIVAIVGVALVGGVVGVIAVVFVVVAGVVVGGVSFSVFVVVGVVRALNLRLVGSRYWVSWMVFQVFHLEVVLYTFKMKFVQLYVGIGVPYTKCIIFGKLIGSIGRPIVSYIGS